MNGYPCDHRWLEGPPLRLRAIARPRDKKVQHLTFYATYMRRTLALVSVTLLICLSFSNSLVDTSLCITDSQFYTTSQDGNESGNNSCQGGVTEDGENAPDREHGESWDNGCNGCSCYNGTVTCTQEVCDSGSSFLSKIPTSLLIGGVIFIVIGVALLSLMGKRPPPSAQNKGLNHDEVAEDIIEAAV